MSELVLQVDWRCHWFAKIFHFKDLRYFLFRRLDPRKHAHRFRKDTESSRRSLWHYCVPFQLSHSLWHKAAYTNYDLGQQRGIIGWDQRWIRHGDTAAEGS